MAVINSPHDYQEDVIKEAFETWNSGLQNICLVAPTGAGKTVIKAFTVKYWLARNPNKYAVIFAHRDVLLNQISMTLAKTGTPHQMLCSKETERQISNEQVEELGECWLQDNAKIIVVSVATWVKRDTSRIEAKTGIWCMDETHHLQKDNMWGQAVENLNHAIGLGVTATPHRADKRGLGRHANGVFDTIIMTPAMGELIQRNRLSAYRVYSTPERFDVSGVNVTGSGDYNQVQLAKKTNKVLKLIIGDAVSEYRRLADGKQGIIFADSVSHANEVAEKFRKAGISAVALSSKSNTTTREREVRKFRNGQTSILVNYDLFGEGFDVPAVTVVIMMRKTLSYGLFKQMFGRCLRVINGKPFGILIDQVGNVRHFLNNELAGKYLHEDPEWTLDDRRDRSGGATGKGLIMRQCGECRGWYAPAVQSLSHYICPHCGHAETQDEFNDEAKKVQTESGVLVELDTSYLDDIIKLRQKVDEPPEKMKSRMEYGGAPRMIISSAVKKHTERQRKQDVLRSSIVKWCEDVGNEFAHDVKTVQGEFNRKFGIDIFKAQTLSARESEELTFKIKYSLYEKLLV